MNDVMDILYEMRKDILRVVDTNVILRNYADRIETAINEERKEWRRMLYESEDAIKTLEQKCTAIEQCQDAVPTCKDAFGEVIREMGGCCSISITCGNCYKCEDVYLVPKRLITKLESVIPQGA